MTALVNRFALVGRSFPSESYEGLQQAFIATRLARRLNRLDRATRAWKGVSEAIVLPKRLSA